jgi:hypothetical protein
MPLAARNVVEGQGEGKARDGPWAEQSHEWGGADAPIDRPLTGT